jgi:23S rRNA pseudouridine2605 synthase
MNSAKPAKQQSKSAQRPPRPVKNPYPKIQAYLSKLGVCSRRKAEQLILEKKIQVDGEIAKIGQRIQPGKSVIVVDGKKITNADKEKKVYYLLDKPVGYVSTVSDDQGRPTVLKLVPAKERIYPVGRLDIDSEGLMMLTNDGTLTYKMTHPSFEIPKLYQVLIQGSPTNKALNHLQRGVKLGGKYVQPDSVTIKGHEQGNTWLEIGVHEGQNRMVRRMMRRIGYPVLRLRRVVLGPFDLNMLEGKTYHKMSQEEVKELVSKI